MKVLCIINPSSGQDYPILAELNRFFHSNNISWDILITDLHQIHQQDFDYAIIYGGDGTVTEYLQQIKKPALILHGGTGNLMAKEIGIPYQVPEALKLLLSPKVQTYDAFTINGNKHYLRAFAGPPIEMLKQVKREDKNKLGLAAYLNAIIQSPKYQPTEFKITFDNQTKTIQTNLIFISNFSSLGIAHLKIDHRIDPQDQKLDLLCLNDVLTISRDHYQNQSFTIEAPAPIDWSIDDLYQQHQKLNIKILPKDFKLLTP